MSNLIPGIPFTILIMQHSSSQDAVLRLNGCSGRYLYTGANSLQTSWRAIDGEGLALYPMPRARISANVLPQIDQSKRNDA
eukprot:scaffold85842_cov23-Cyclotella_meneghiniana.AAC.1